jgi:hypothetical protein
VSDLEQDYFDHPFYESPEWAAIRLRYFETRPEACWVCGSTVSVQLHHTSYEGFGGQEALSDLVALCDTHHRRVHDYARRVRVLLEVAHLGYAFERYDRGNEWWNLPGRTWLDGTASNELIKTFRAYGRSGRRQREASEHA